VHPIRTHASDAIFFSVSVRTLHDHEIALEQQLAATRKKTHRIEVG
jgi:hypothetical protein